MSKTKLTGRGGTRRGAGRPTRFSGPKDKVTVKLTRKLMRVVKRTEKQMAKEHGSSSISQAVEALARRGANIPDDGLLVADKPVETAEN